MKNIIIIIFLCLPFYNAFSQVENEGPILSFIKDRHDFGKIPLDSMPEDRRFDLEIEFKNSGDEPLVVQNVRACCGTRVTDWTKSPVMPNETGVIKIHFTLRAGTQRISRTVTATSNCSKQPSQIFRLLGEVVN